MSIEKIQEVRKTTTKPLQSPEKTYRKRKGPKELHPLSIPYDLEGPHVSGECVDITALMPFRGAPMYTHRGVGRHYGTVTL